MSGIRHSRKQQVSAETRASFLGESDETLFTHGACHIFAAKLHELFGYPLRACRDSSDGIAHCYAVRDGEGIDAIGPIDRAYFREDFTFERVEVITPSALIDYFRTRFPREDSKEISDSKTFNQIASERAERFITANLDRFGHRRSD